MCEIGYVRNGLMRAHMRITCKTDDYMATVYKVDRARISCINCEYCKSAAAAAMALRQRGAANIPVYMLHGMIFSTGQTLAKIN